MNQLHYEIEGNTGTVHYMTEKGTAICIGNALRRVLLSSLRGSAVSSFQLACNDKLLLHEYQCLEGVKEDGCHIVNNLKGIIIKAENLENVSATAICEFTGPGVLKAGDFNYEIGYSCLNPDHPICTVTKASHLYFEIHITSGRGVSVEKAGERREGKYSIGTIPIDAMYQPVKSVNICIKEIDAFEEELTLTVTTDGKCTPTDAVSEAAAILTSHFALFDKENVPENTEAEEEMTAEDERKEALKETSIAELELSVRAFNSLMRTNIRTIGDITERTFSELSKIRNFGAKSIYEVIDKIHSLRLHLKDEVPPEP